MKENFNILRSGAAGSTLIAGILHLSLVAGVIDRNFNTGILFLIGGLAQVFWVLPTLMGWNKAWYYVGISWYFDLHDNLGSDEISREPN